MQELISILKLFITSNLFNFVVMVILLAYIVKKMNLGQSFENAVNAVKSNIDKSDDEKNRAQSLLDKAKDLMNKLQDDINNLENNAKSKLEVFKAKIEKDAQKSISGFEMNIDRAVTLEEKKLSNLLTDRTTRASVEAARVHIEKMLNENPELHNKFIQDSLDELDRISL